MSYKFPEGIWDLFEIEYHDQKVHLKCKKCNEIILFPQGISPVELTSRLITYMNQHRDHSSDKKL